jgi:putative tryptophan/tyrosine transport system substrate-binding protein
MRRRDFAIGLLLTTAVGKAPAQEQAKPHRIAIIIPAGPVALISATGNRYWLAFFEELRRLGDVEGQNLIVDRYSGEGWPESFAGLARGVINRNPDVIVAITNPVALAARAANATIPIVWTGIEPIRAGLAASLAHPGGNTTGVIAYDLELWGKLLQILKEAVPSAAKVAFLTMRTSYSQQFQQSLRETSQRLKISLLDMVVHESTPSEHQRVFAEIAQDRPDAIIVSGLGDLYAYLQLIVELIEKSRLPAIYPWRDAVELGGLMAYESDLGELWRRMADDVHQILNGARPDDIPIYQPTKFEFVINLKAAKALGLTLPPSLLAAADEVVE